MRLVEPVLIDEQYVDPAVRVNGYPCSREHDSNFVLISCREDEVNCAKPIKLTWLNFLFLTAKGLLVPGEQVEAAPARRLVRVVAQLAALPEGGVAAEARAGLEPARVLSILVPNYKLGKFT